MPGFEKLERAQEWWAEIVNGPSTVRGLQRLQQEYQSQIRSLAVTDCRGLWDSLTGPVIGNVLDSSMLIYLIAAREMMDIGRLAGVAWVPTQSMLVDGCTKPMVDVLWKRYYETSEWVPQEALVCERNAEGHKKISKFGGPSLLTLLTEVETFEEDLEEEETLAFLVKHVTADESALENAGLSLFFFFLVGSSGA